jgi:hypothetical protein
MTTATSTRTSSIDLTAAPRAVLRESVRLLYRVLGEHRMGSARANAWAAICADREAAQGRAEMTRLLDAARHRR